MSQIDEKTLKLQQILKRSHAAKKKASGAPSTPLRDDIDPKLYAQLQAAEQKYLNKPRKASRLP